MAVEIHVGFTGTRKGMTAQQRERFTLLLRSLAFEEGMGHFHHGCADGADTEAATISKDQGWWVVGHPGIDPKTKVVRSNWTNMDDETRDPYRFLVRNRHIVQSSDMMIATPRTATQMARSGTWYTIRYARTESKDLYIIFPDGIVREEKGVS